MTLHQYLERETSRLITEKFLGQAAVRFIYGGLRENAPFLFRVLTGRRISGLIGFVSYDLAIGSRISGHLEFLKTCGVDLRECLASPGTLNTLRKVFERKIRYWECRTMPDDPRVIVSPADSRVLVGSHREGPGIFIKSKLYDYEELIGRDRWLEAFREGDFAVFRLTPDKYHYNHTPVAGRVVDYYEIEGSYHSCNPAALVSVLNSYSRNRRVVTVIDTDVRQGTGVGLVAMIEIVALMIGRITQCYSDERYDDPRPLTAGMFLRKGVPKSLYSPGSSTDVLLFQRGRIEFSADIMKNMRHPDAKSLFTMALEDRVAETDVKVRSEIARGLCMSKLENGVHYDVC